jgi:hypothetical protein
MKKFVLDQVGTSGKSGRSGNSGGLERTAVCSLDGISAIKTPALWIGTKSGAVPTLTPETVELGGLAADPDMFAGLLVPLQDLLKSADVFQSYQKGELGKGLSFSGKRHGMLKLLKDTLYSYQKGERYCSCYFKMGKGTFIIWETAWQIKALKRHSTELLLTIIVVS